MSVFFFFFFCICLPYVKFSCVFVFVYLFPVQLKCDRFLMPSRLIFPSFCSSPRNDLICGCWFVCFVCLLLISSVVYFLLYTYTELVVTISYFQSLCFPCVSVFFLLHMFARPPSINKNNIKILFLLCFRSFSLCSFNFSLIDSCFLFCFLFTIICYN